MSEGRLGCRISTALGVTENGSSSLFSTDRGGGFFRSPRFRSSSFSLFLSLSLSFSSLSLSLFSLSLSQTHTHTHTHTHSLSLSHSLTHSHTLRSQAQGLHSSAGTLYSIPRDGAGARGSSGVANLLSLFEDEQRGPYAKEDLSTPYRETGSVTLSLSLSLSISLLYTERRAR